MNTYLGSVNMMKTKPKTRLAGSDDLQPIFSLTRSYKSWCSLRILPYNSQSEPKVFKPWCYLYFQL